MFGHVLHVRVEALQKPILKVVLMLLQISVSDTNLLKTEFFTPGFYRVR